MGTTSPAPDAGAGQLLTTYLAQVSGLKDGETKVQRGGEGADITQWQNHG